MADTTFSSFLRIHNLRDTQPRRLVFEALKSLKTPASPYDIRDWVDRKHKLNISTVTVYRIAEVFIDLGLAHRHPCGGGIVLCAEPGKDGLHGYLHCHDCGTSEEFCSLELATTLRKQTKKRRFHAQSPLLEVTGSCANCAS
jgi:Fur family transcriptional regulator, zinc uptake regulator